MSEIKTEKKYIETVGRRKTSVARVRLTPSTKSSFKINDKTIEDYFKIAEQRAIVLAAISEMKLEQKFEVTVVVKGGGVNSQAEAIRHAIARALITFDLTLRKDLKKAGYLKRDPRAKERRKFGLKKARKAPQWSKR
ncbi:MAG: 30S ribosomal protein S9 [Candidatus Taylorbacteria bacterium RIFOXYD2_FULL_36_9]|uniref:Small ribosomal subunit protein uS9 n=1 Tax=Candidatus Taylorbacteria bacterium RIFOXYD2_FULL_36_9 TaxID=1802338 RepID=A0A1G2PDZ4_9BACT|nr:MAG: 30S ribosomal protein S9 [Candidatus Taylorbacteria bacterium RIFOXYD2_FULL_36_9]